MANRLLILDSSENTGKKISRYFSQKDWEVCVCPDLQKVLHQLDKNEFDPHVLLIEIGDADWQLNETLGELREYLEYCDVVINAASELRENWDDEVAADIDELIYAVTSSTDNPKHLAPVLKRALRSSLTRRRLHRYASHEKQQYNVGAFIGSSELATELRLMFKRLTEVPLSTLVITGETGTGKGLVAKILHYSGLRAGEPIVELNCAALPKELLESQLFGHEAGAFTGAKARHRGLFEQANGGTLFLDEIGDMDLDLQAKLLKAIEDKKIRRLGSEREINVDVQIFAATGVDLQQAGIDGGFREDLYHRLNVFNIALPPLRERKNDLVELVPIIVAEFNQKANKKIATISDDVWEKLLSHDWPGNIRELRNVIERCVLMSTDEKFPASWLQLEHAGIAPVNEEKSISIPLDGSMTLDDMERYILLKVLEEYDFNVSESAKALGATRETLRYRIQKYDIKKEKK